MYNLGLLAERAGDLQSATRWYRQAAEGGNDVAMSTLGYLAKDVGDLDAARTWFEAAVDAGNTDAITNLATVLDAQGDTDAATRWYRRAIEAGSTNAMLNLGNLLTEQGDPAAAAQWYAKAAAAGNASAMYNLGNHLVQAGDTQAGADWLRRAADAGHVAAANNLAIVLNDDGDTEQARAWFERAAQSGDTKAMNNLGDLLAQASGDPRAKYHLGAMAARDGNLQPLRTWFLDGVDADTADARPLGHLLMELGDLDTLRDGLRRAFTVSNPMAVNIGTLLVSGGDTATVQASFQDAARAGNKVLITMMAKMLVHLGHVDPVRTWFGSAVDSNDLVLIAGLGWVLYDGPDPDLVRDAARTLDERGHRDTAEQLGYVELTQPIFGRVPLAVRPHLELDRLPLYLPHPFGNPVWPADQQIDAPAPDAVLSLDVPAAVHDPVQVRHHDQLRCLLVIHRAIHQNLAVLTPEVDEPVQQSPEVQAAVRRDDVAAPDRDPVLGERTEHPHDHFTVDRVGDPGRRRRRDQTEIA
jgi:Tfp pilus assembly protein PilF